MRVLLVLCLSLLIAGCSGAKSKDSRVYARSGVGSDTLGDNPVTRAVTNAFAALTGKGIVIDSAVTRIDPDSGFLELYVSGHNQSPSTKRFRYRVEWLDGNGMVIETKTSVWLRMSAMGKCPFHIKAVAPRKEAIDFRMDTRKWE